MAGNELVDKRKVAKRVGKSKKAGLGYLRSARRNSGRLLRLIKTNDRRRIMESDALVILTANDILAIMATVSLVAVIGLCVIFVASKIRHNEHDDM